MTITRGERTSLRTLVLANKALFVFTLDRAADERERKAFATFLAGVDFDMQ